MFIAGFRPRPRRRMIMALARHWSLLATYLRPQRRNVLLLAVLLLSSIGLQLLSPQIIGSFIDTTQTHGSQRALATAAILYLAVALGQRGASLARLSR